METHFVNHSLTFINSILDGKPTTEHINLSIEKYNQMVFLIGNSIDYLQAEYPSCIFSNSTLSFAQLIHEMMKSLVIKYKTLIKNETFRYK
jgi:hypothetical protein